MLPLAKHSILVYNISTSATMHMICESKYVTALRLLAVSELNNCNINQLHANLHSTEPQELQLLLDII